MRHSIVNGPPNRAVAKAWQDFLQRSEFASSYTAPYFLSVPFFREQGAFAVLVFEEEDIVAAATGVCNTKFVECGNAASPQVIIDGNCDHRAAARQIANGLLNMEASQTVSAFCWGKSPGFVSMGFKEKEIASPLAPRMIDLREGAERIFKAFSATARNEVRKAIKVGVNVAELQLDSEFDEYYEIYESWSRAKNLPAVAADVLRASLAQSSNRLILAARIEGRIIAASSFRHYGSGLVEYASNVSRFDDRKFRPNGLLVWTAIEWASSRGFRWFSMGGDHFFLSQFGGAVHPVYRYRKDLTLLRKNDARDWAREKAAGLYKRMPAPVREKLTPLLRRVRLANS